MINGSKQYVIEDKWEAVEKEKMRNINRLTEASKILLVAEVLAKKGKKEVSFGIDCATRVEKIRAFQIREQVVNNRSEIGPCRWLFSPW